MDGRRRQWVPIASDLPWTRTGRYLYSLWGRDGLLVWMLVLAAAKRSFVQGTFEYVTEAEGWRKLGIEDDPPEHFTLGDFFDATGRIKSTRRDRKQSVGTRKVIEITAWTEWNQTVERQLRNEQKARKRARSTGDNTVPLSPPDSDLDLDSDSDSEKRRVAHQREENRKQADAFLAVLKKQTGGQK